MSIVPKIGSLATIPAWINPATKSYDALQEKRTSNQNNYVHLLAHILNHPGIWTNQTFIQKVDGWLKDAFEEATLYLEHIKIKARTNNPETVAHVMSDHSTTPNLYMHFFYAGFLEIYHLARNHMTTEADPVTNKTVFVAPKTYAQIDQSSFFNPQAVQYQWREMYNEICARMDALGVRPYLAPEFNAWTQPDNTPFTGPMTDWRPLC